MSENGILHILKTIPISSIILCIVFLFLQGLSQKIHSIILPQKKSKKEIMRLTTVLYYFSD